MTWGGRLTWGGGSTWGGGLTRRLLVPRGRVDLPLAQTAPARFLPWLVGALVYGSAVALGIAMIADHALRSYDRRAQLVTVTLPLADAGAPAADVAAALDVLHRTPGVIAATPIASDELRALMKPWLGETRGGGDLLLPRLIDVTLDPQAKPDLTVLQDALRGVVSGATIGVEPVTPDRAERMAGLVRAWSVALAVVVLSATLVAIGAVTGSTVRLIADAVELLRCMGASDRYLADQFERHALSGGLRAAASGFGLALVTLAAVLFSSRRMDVAGATTIWLQPIDWVLLAGVALTGLLLAVAVVRASALRGLQPQGSGPGGPG